MAREYAKITFYRGGTIEDPSDPYVVEGEYNTVIVDSTMTIASMFEFKMLNYHKEHTDEFFSGDIVEIDIGTAANHEVTLGGLIFAVEYEEDIILVRGYDWSHYLVGPRIVTAYGDMDYGEVLRQVLIRFVPNLKYNFLLDTKYILQQPYAGGYNTAINVFNDLTEQINYDWDVRPDREVVIMPNGLQIDFIDGFKEEVDNEDPDGWTEVSGTWSVQSNKYQGSIASARAITRTSITTSTYQDIRCVMNLDAGDSIFIIYDFQSSSDFKYAMYDEANDYIRIGYWNGSWNHQASVAKTIAEDTDYCVRVVIVDNKVTIYSWDSTNEEWDSEVDYTFGSMGTGTIGIGAEGTTMVVDFDDFVIYSAGLSSIDVDDDAISWSIAKKDLRDMVNRTTVIGGKETFEDNFISGTLWQWGTFYQSGTTSTATIVDEELEIDCEADATAILWTIAKYKNQVFEAKVKSVDKGVGWVNTPALVFRGEDNTNYYRARIDCDSNKLQVYKIVDETPTLLKEVDYTFNTGTYYTIRVKTTLENIKVYVNGSNKIDFKDVTFGIGYSGLEVIDGKATFDDVLIVTDRDIIATATDPTLIAKWGEKSADPIRDDSIKNRDAANARVSLELNRYRFEKTRGLIKIEGDINIKLGDVIKLTSVDCAINNDEYRIFGVTHIIDDAEGYVTVLNVAENFTGVEEVIRVESTRGTYLSWVGILARALIQTMTDTIYYVTDSVDLEVREYQQFYFDEHETFGYSYWDFSTFN